MDAAAHHLDRRVLTVWRVGWLVGAGSVVAATVVTAAGVSLAGAATVPPWVWPVVALVAVAAGAWCWWWPSVRYRHWTYALGEEAIELEHGVAFRTRSVVPYFRVQHVDTSQGPIDRRLALTNLTIHTASAATDATLPGLATAEAVRVRQLVLERAGDGDAV
jgi:membrane protein YdbS with pleckstrin-like domain